MSITEHDPTTTESIRNESILGRADLDDLEAILAVSNTHPDEVEHAVKDNAEAIFTWDYSLQRPQLRKLYEKARPGSGTPPPTSPGTPSRLEGRRRR
jgi:hypothetical protein